MNIILTGVGIPRGQIQKHYIKRSSNVTIIDSRELPSGNLILSSLHLCSPHSFVFNVVFHTSTFSSVWDLFLWYPRKIVWNLRNVNQTLCIGLSKLDTYCNFIWRSNISVHRTIFCIKHIVLFIFYSSLQQYTIIKWTYIDLY